MGCKNATLVRSSGSDTESESMSPFSRASEKPGSRAMAAKNDRRPNSLIDLCLPRPYDPDAELSRQLSLGDAPLSPLSYRDLHIAILRRRPNNANEWAIVGNLMSEDEVMEVGGKCFTRKAMFVQALRRNIGCGFAWLKLAESMDETEVVRIWSTSQAESVKVVNTQQALIEAITHNPSSAASWDALGALLEPSNYHRKAAAAATTAGAYSPDERRLHRDEINIIYGDDANNSDDDVNDTPIMAEPTVEVLGSTYAKRDLHLEALRCDPTCVSALRHLGCFAITPNTCRKDVFIAAASVDPENMNAWRGLAAEMRRGEVVVVEGIKLSRKDVLLLGIRCHVGAKPHHNHWSPTTL